MPFAVFLAVAQTFLEKPNNVCLSPLSVSFSDGAAVWVRYTSSDL